jgi:outer membrane protein OmpA-like peptidoglycan-associated protein
VAAPAAAPEAAPLGALVRGIAIYFKQKLNLLEPDEARGVIAALAEALKARGGPGNEQERLRVVGYSDPSGSAERNQRVSLARAELVVKMLVAAGVAPDKLVAVARPGDSATPHESGADRKLDRRVIFEPIEPEAVP